MTKIQKNLLIVWPKIVEHIQEDEVVAEEVAVWLESYLDDLAMDDYFGSERQCDPRGDMRTKEWSLFRKVEE